MSINDKWVYLLGKVHDAVASLELLRLEQWVLMINAIPEDKLERTGDLET